MQLHILPRPPADNQVLFVIFFPVLFGLFFVDSIAIFVVTSHDNTRPPEHGQDEEEDYDQDCREDSTETTKKIMNKTVKKSSRPAQFLQKKNLPRPGAAANSWARQRIAAAQQQTPAGSGASEARQCRRDGGVPGKERRGQRSCCRGSNQPRPMAATKPWSPRSRRAGTISLTGKQRPASWK